MQAVQTNNVTQFPTQQQSMSLAAQTGFKVDAILDAQLMTSKAFPRNIKRAMENVEFTVGMNPEVASSCCYALPRAGKNIEGASIRLAEIFSSFWGNIQAGTKFIFNNGKTITVEGWAWDLEGNFKVSCEVSKSIVGKNGQYSADMQATTIAAASAIAYRNAIFKIIPKIFIDQAYQKALDTIASHGDQGKFEQNKTVAFDKLAQKGIKAETILCFFRKTSIQEIDREDLKVIYGVGTSIAEGHIKAEDAFKSHQSNAEKVGDMIVDSDEHDADTGEINVN